MNHRKAKLLLLLAQLMPFATMCEYLLLKSLWTAPFTAECQVMVLCLPAQAELLETDRGPLCLSPRSVNCSPERMHSRT